MTLALLRAELAAPELFDEGVEAARNACVAGASIAAAAIAAAAWYDNPLTGTGALEACMATLADLPLERRAWQAAFTPKPHAFMGDRVAPGFGFVTAGLARAVAGAAQRLFEGQREPSRGAFFLAHAEAICALSGPLNAAGLAALSFVDLGLDAETAERWFLCTRIEVAIAEAQKARTRGVSAFPFFGDAYHYDGARPEPRPLDLAALRKEAGLD